MLIRAARFVQDRHEVTAPGTPGHALPRRPRTANGGAEHNQTLGGWPGPAKPEPDELDEPDEPDMPGQWCVPGDAFGVDGVVGVVAVGVDDVDELPPVAALANAALPPASAPVTTSAATSLLICIGLLS